MTDSIARGLALVAMSKASRAATSGYTKAQIDSMTWVSSAELQQDGSILLTNKDGTKVSIPKDIPHFVGTTAQLNAAIQAGTIENGTIIIVTDDYPSFDDELNINSYNAVQNSVVTAAINDIQSTIGDINSVLEEVL